jgi:hypothetical protein
MHGIVRTERARLQESGVHNNVLSDFKEVVVEVCL